MGTISFCAAAFFLSICVLFACSTDVATSTNREALEIIIGGGGAPPPENEACPPPPPPPEPLCPPPPPVSPFESKRIEIVYPVIQKFKRRITKDPHGITKTWVGYDICRNYKGFFCDRVPDFKVQALAGVDFNGFNFAGPDFSLHGFIEELPDITVFHANSNNFSGTVPAKIASLRYFYELDLSNNQLSGAFPAEVLAATKLTFLDLRFNRLSGTVPAQVFTLDLDVLFINDNNFVQRLPENLGATPVLYLTLANNKFIGEIPRSIAKASNTLIEVLLLNNQLSGCLPCEIGLLKKTTVFDVSRNHLTGPIPHSFACLEKMEVLNLGQNELYGPIPDMICQLPNLENFSLAYNYFTQVGPECWKLIKRNVLDVRMNCIPGLPMQRPKAQCEAFFYWPRSCPNQKSLGWVPCSKTHLRPNSEEPLGGLSTALAGSPWSYKALESHRH